MKKLLLLLVCVVCVVCVVGSPVKAAILYQTGFESPTYALGNLNSQDGWTSYTGTRESQSIIAGGAPEGSQMAKLVDATGSQVGSTHSFTTLNSYDDIVVDIMIAKANMNTWGGDAGDAATVFINNPGAAWNGAKFGFLNQGYIFAHDDSIAGSNHYRYVDFNPVTPEVDTAPDNTFFRFVVTIHPTTAKYDLDVYDMNGYKYDTSALQGMTVRGSITSFNQIKLMADDNGEAVLEMYVDALTISQVPEPATIGLLGIGMLGLISKRKGN